MDKKSPQNLKSLTIKEVDPAAPKNEISQRCATFLIIKISDTKNKKILAVCEMNIKEVDPAAPKNEISQKYATFLITKISKNTKDKKILAVCKMDKNHLKI